MTNDANSNDKTPDVNKDSEQDRASELASFLRSLGVKALDHLAARIVEKRFVGKKQPKPIRKIAEHWSDMNIAQKERFFEQVISAAQVIAAAAPAVIAGAAARKAGKKAKKAKAKEPAPAKKSVKPETKKKEKKANEEKGKRKRISEAKDSKATKPKKPKKS